MHHQSFQLGLGRLEFLLPDSGAHHPIAAVGMLAKLLQGPVNGMGLPIAEELRKGEGGQELLFTQSVLRTAGGLLFCWVRRETVLEGHWVGESCSLLHTQTVSFSSSPSPSLGGVSRDNSLAIAHSSLQ